MSGQLEVGPVHLAEYTEIAEIHRRSFIATYANVTPEITEEVLSEHADDEWVARIEARNRNEVAQGKATLTVARLAGEPAGFCKVEKSGQGGALYVDPAYRGHIIGPYLLRPGLEISMEHGLTITVVPNTPAVGFYGRLGFRPPGRDLACDELPRLRGGHILPLVELNLPAERAVQTLERIDSLFARAGLTLTT